MILLQLCTVNRRLKNNVGTIIYFFLGIVAETSLLLLFQQIVHVTVEPVSFSLISIKSSVNIIDQIILRVELSLEGNAEIFQAAETVGHLIQI